MYRQIDGVAMGSPLGSALANIFVGFYESKLFDKISKPQIYYRYVDDTFALFQDEVDSETFLTNLNSLHTCIHPQRCPVYLKLPWIGKTSVIFEKKIKSNILNCFSTVQPRVIFSTRRILPAIHKDVLPASQQAWSYTNTCAAANAGTWAELLNVCRTESANMSRKLSATKPIKKEFSQREKVK